MGSITCTFTSNNSTEPGWQHYCGSEANYSIIGLQGHQRLFGFHGAFTMPGEAAYLLPGSLLVLTVSSVLTMLNT